MNESLTPNVRAHAAERQPPSGRALSQAESHDRGVFGKKFGGFCAPRVFNAWMQPESDAQLLREWAERGSEPAFTQLVTRYTNLVYSAALRQVDSVDLAAEVAQEVFIGLARGAQTLSPRLAENASLAGWLCRSARNLSLNVRRDEFRRHSRERQAMEDFSPLPENAPDWERLRPVLDEAMSELSEPDHDALVMRFFHDQDFRAIGTALGASENAAQKRVSHALDKLREHLNRRGITTTAAALSVVLSANAIQVAPSGLAATLTAAALSSAPALVPAAGAATAKGIVMTTLQKTLIATAFAAAIGTGIYQARQASVARQQVQQLHEQHAAMGEEMQRLQRQRDAATARLALLADEKASLEDNSAELLRLRSEVGRLRRESQEFARLKSTNPGTEPDSEEAWLQRVKLLRQRLEQTPEAKIPEFQYLEQFDWLTAAKHKLENEEDYRVAFAALRSSAVGNFVHLVETAFQKYLQANNGQFPTEVSQLKPFFDSPPGDDVLERYKMAPAANPLGSSGAGNTNDWIITLKSPQDGGNWHIGPGGSSTFVDDPQMAILAPAMKAAMNAAPLVNGAKRLDIHQIAPYLTTPEQKAAYEELLRHSK